MLTRARGDEMRPAAIGAREHAEGNAESRREHQRERAKPQ